MKGEATYDNAELARAIAASGLGVSEVARRSGVNRQNLSAMVHGHLPVTEATAKQLAPHLDGALWWQLRTVRDQRDRDIMRLIGKLSALGDADLASVMETVDRLAGSPAATDRPPNARPRRPRSP
jgi:hypothetical protein